MKVLAGLAGSEAYLLGCRWMSSVSALMCPPSLLLWALIASYKDTGHWIRTHPNEINLNYLLQGYLHTQSHSETMGMRASTREF